MIIDSDVTKNGWWGDPFKPKILGQIPTSVTLNDLERCNSLYFTEIDSFAGLLRHSVDDRSAEYIVFHFWPQLAHPAERSLCDS